MRDHPEKIPDGLLPAQMALDLTEVVDVYESDAERWGKTLIKASTIQDAEDLVDLCRQRGILAATVNSRTPPASRKDIIQRFRKDALDILVVIGIGTFGLDVPALRTIFITHAMGSPNGYVQLVGRGSRIFDVDFFNVVELHPGLARMRPELWRAPLISSPSMPRGDVDVRLRLEEAWLARQAEGSLEDVRTETAAPLPQG
jgi:hypothetical protein